MSKFIKSLSSYKSAFLGADLRRAGRFDRGTIKMPLALYFRTQRLLATYDGTQLREDSAALMDAINHRRVYAQRPMSLLLPESVMLRSEAKRLKQAAHQSVRDEKLKRDERGAFKARQRAERERLPKGIVGEEEDEEEKGKGGAEEEEEEDNQRQVVATVTSGSAASEALVSREDLKEIVHSTLSKRLDTRAMQTIRYGRRESIAYLAERMNNCYGATYRVLHDLSALLPDLQPDRVLDFGSGLGSTVWAVREAFGRRLDERTFTLVDTSEAMNELCNVMLKGPKQALVDAQTAKLASPRGRVYRDEAVDDAGDLTKGVSYSRFLPLGSEWMRHFDLVVSGQSLSELPSIKMKVLVLRALWNATRDSLVIIEPGTKEGHDNVLFARNMIVNHFHLGKKDKVDSGHIVAPCPHSMECPLANTPMGCVFGYQVNATERQTMTRTVKSQGHKVDHYSYVVLRKNEADTGVRPETPLRDSDVSRLVKHAPDRRRAHIEMKLCTPEGALESRTLTSQQDGALLWSDARRRHVGDLWSPRLAELAEGPRRDRFNRWQENDDGEEEEEEEMAEETVEEEVVKPKRLLSRRERLRNIRRGGTS